MKVGAPINCVRLRRLRPSGVENIHVMRSSLQKLLEACDVRQPTMSAFHAGVDASGWLKHIQAILKTSHFIARAVALEHISVLVHCSGTVVS